MKSQHRKLIVAGNYLQAREYMRENKLGMRDAMFVAHRQMLLGIENPDVVYVGTYRERPDIVEIMETVRAMTRPT